MITNNELAASRLSATKKDYYQIWNELLDLASKISERWDPQSTNESDPGIILLKVLTAIGDKLNYNIDANILEAYMPSAAQMESMRKLCEMMGYNVKYYQSAVTDISFAYVGDPKSFTEDEDWHLDVPIFTAITNNDHDVNYVTVEQKTIAASNPTQTIKCMEGQVVRCETDNNNIITLNQLDDNKRYYLPETQIAENGIFIYGINNGLKSQRWEKVENLNTQPFKKQIYKFGYDSMEHRPYLQFPIDIDQIIEDGLEIYYIRTSGVNGNIAPHILSTFEKPADETWEKVLVEDIIISNASAAANGKNIETINQAYNNYKRTIGTFDTLVTCRDYMNTIYNLINDSNVPVVSNIIVSDIRNDINRSTVLCSFDDYGISYLDKALQQVQTVTMFDKDFPAKSINTTIQEDAIKSFDLVLYPFKKVYGLNTKEEYENSFKLDTENATKRLIEQKLSNVKNIAHNFVYPKSTDIVCIKNYLKLDAKITTTTKINTAEEFLILTAIKASIFEKFNARQLDFGEEIPFESILECIENADARIKNVSLAEPTIYTKFEMADGSTYDFASYIAENIDNTNINIHYPGREVFNKLALRNVLAGRLELFNYDHNFSQELTENNYGYVYDLDKKEQIPYSSVYPNNEVAKIVQVDPECSFNTDATIKIHANELIKFRAPNIKTMKTFPAYVNYFIHLNDTTGVDKQPIPATFITLRKYLANGLWDSAKNMFLDSIGSFKSLKKAVIDADTFNTAEALYGALFTIKDGVVTLADSYVADTEYFYLPVNMETFPLWVKWVRAQTYDIDAQGTKNNLYGIYRTLGYSATNTAGFMIDENLKKYRESTRWHNYPESEALDNYFIQQTFRDETETHTQDGLGKDAVYVGIKKNTEYQLKPGEYLAINYTPAAKDQQAGPEPLPVNELYTGPTADKLAGDIIRPNFDLKDSVKTNIFGKQRYSKTTGYSFEGKEVPGMFSLKAQDQIELRDFVQVKLEDPVTYLYWTLKNEDVTIKEIADNHVYTLKDGEYLYYTDINKTAMAYYGSGTEIIFKNGANLRKQSKDKEVSADDIVSKGLTIIPWLSYSFGSGAMDPKLIIREYQYITLTENDTINNVKFSGKGITEINKNWQSVISAEYIISNELKTLPLIAVKDPATGNDISWDVRSYLMLNISPKAAQVLNKNDKITIKYDNNTALALQPRLSSNDSQAQPINLSLKANYVYQTLDEYVDVKKYRSYGADTQEEINDFKIKLFETKPIGAVYSKSGILDPGVIMLHNFGDLWSSAFFGKLTDKTDYLKFYLNIPDTTFGLMMINYSGEYDPEGAYIEFAPIGNNETAPIPKIYNYRGVKGAQPSDIWWDENYTYEDSNHKTRYLLKRGINIVKIDSACILKIYPDAALIETITFSDIDLVNRTNPLNLNILGYQIPVVEPFVKIPEASTQEPDPTKIYLSKSRVNDSNGKYIYKLHTNLKVFDSNYDWYKQKEINKVSAEELLLSDIRKADIYNKFYYNCPMDNSLAIDLNPKLLGTPAEEILSDAHIWYDSNNINNNFVISEIDADYLDSGIQIARTSKR